MRVATRRAQEFPVRNEGKIKPLDNGPCRCSLTGSIHRPPTKKIQKMQEQTHQIFLDVVNYTSTHSDGKQARPVTGRSQTLLEQNPVSPVSPIPADVHKLTRHPLGRFGTRRPHIAPSPRAPSDFGTPTTAPTTTSPSGHRHETECQVEGHRCGVGRAGDRVDNGAPASFDSREIVFVQGGS